MCNPGSPCAVRLTLRIDVQDDFRNFLPVCASAVGVEKAEVSDQVLFIIGGEHIGYRCGIGDVRIKWRLLHDILSTVHIATAFS